MTQSIGKVVFGSAYEDFLKHMVGIDDQLHRLSKVVDMSKTTTNYPPYNILKRKENVYEIQMAVAGFEEDDLDIEVHDGKLTIQGHVKSHDKNEEYIFKGIAKRSFVRSFVLDETVQVQAASLEKNGMLIITLERIVPEHLKPRKILLSSKENGLLLENVPEA